MSASDSPSILFVEDNPQVRLLIREQLQETYDLVLASDAEEALNVLDNGPFDLFLLDIKLGQGRSGTELLHLLRDLEPTKGVPAVALTTYGMPGDREALLDAGFDGYVSKPFTGAELSNTIDQTLSAGRN
ncbi:MAG: response regulator [Salinibacter sp.]|uniref:response regulator n=1 Tax=Salinibacter sp. TaxID=2065818 RepID=UPI0035D4F76E